jgi:hypothetical protein
MKKIITLFLTFTSLILITGCSDEKGADPTPDNNSMEFASCRIMRTDRENFASRIYTYNDEGKLVSFSNGSSLYEYFYNPGKVIIKWHSYGELQRTGNVDLNGDGFATHIEEVFENGVTPKRITDFVYNDKNQLIKKTQRNEGSVNEIITVYQWQNGNMVSESNPDLSDMTKYTYTTNLTQPAEWFNTINLDRGYRTVMTKNRVKTVQLPHITYTHLYSEDTSGLIKSITVTDTDGGSYTRTYTYGCD